MPLSELPAPQANSDRITLEDAGEGCTRIFAQVIGGLSSLPEGTINAIALVAGYLHEVMDAQPDLFDPAERSYLDLLSVVHDGTAGEGLGIAAESDAFGALTCNAGTIEVADGHILQTIDVRYPDSTTSDEMTMICGAHASRFGAEFIAGRAKEPFSVSADSPDSTTSDEMTMICGAHASRFGAEFIAGRAKEPFSVSADSPAVRALLDTYRECQGALQRLR